MAREITTIESPLTTFPAITDPGNPETMPQECQAILDALALLPGKLDTLVTTTNAAASDLRGLADDAVASADSAAAQVPLAAIQVGLATDQASASATSAAQALASATAATAVAPAWVSGTSYSYPQIAVGSDGQTYRCMGADVVGDDPANGTANWIRLTGAASGGSAVFNFENYGGF